MARINLDTLSLSELKSLQKDIAKAIADFSDLLRSCPWVEDAKESRRAPTRNCPTLA